MDILLVVVIYNKKVENIKYLAELNDVRILIYDNSPEEQKVSSKYYYFHNGINSGVSAGYNYGIKLALELNIQFVILLDQDTEFNKGTLNEYRNMNKRYGKKYIYAPIIVGNNKIYSPFWERYNRNLPQKSGSFVYEEIYNLNRKSVINSGLMIPIDIINKIGYYNEQIKLDFSDISFIEKYKEINSEIVLLNLQLEHSISGDEGKDKGKELGRFKYYCNGAREFKKNSKQASRINRMLFFRMLRLILKYRTIKPIFIVKDYYFGVHTI